MVHGLGFGVWSCHLVLAGTCTPITRTNVQNPAHPKTYLPYLHSSTFGSNYPTTFSLGFNGMSRRPLLVMGFGLG